MADDISKKYAVNIDLNVNSSNIDKLNDAENILDKAFSEPQKTSQQERNQSSQQINVDTSSIESKIEKIISIISSQDKESKRSLDEAVIRAISDSFKSSLLEIFKHVNSVFSTRANQQSDLEKPVEVISPQKKTPKNSENNASIPSTSSDMAATGEIQLASGNTANTSLLQKKMMERTESTTGVSVKVVKDSNAVSNGAIATTIHSQNPSIHLARGVDRISEYSSMPHEYLHVLQQSKMFNANSFLSNIFGGGGSFDKGVIKKANEFVTNVISSIYAALDKNLSDTDFNAIKNTYISSIMKASGIEQDIAGAAISSVDMIRGLNISPEAMGGIIGRDISGLSLKNGTELERAIAFSGKKNISLKNGQIFIGRGKNKKELTSIDDIYNLGLKNQDGHAIDRSVIASHFISRGVINGLGSIEVSRSGSEPEKINTISSFGFGKTRKQAGSEFSEQSSFGIPFLPQEELRRRFETRNTVISIEQLKSILSSAVGDTYNGRVVDRESGKEFDVKRTSAKRHNNFRFGLNKFQSLAYALGGDDTLRIAEENGLGNVKNNAEALNIIRIAHLFKGDASAETKHISGLSKYQKHNYDELVRLFEGSASSYLSQEEFSPVTYKGFRSNIDNQNLANAIYTAGGLQRGVKTGRIPSYYVSDKSEHVKPGVSKAFNAGNVSLNKEKENGEGDTQELIDTIGGLDEGLQAETIDTKEIKELKEKFSAVRYKLETLREQIKNRRKITSGINREDIALIGNGQDFGMIKLESNEKMSAEDRKSAISKIDDMLIVLAKRAEQELVAARERLGEDYSDYNINIAQSSFDIFSDIIEKYKRENNKSFSSERDASIAINDALQQILGYDDERINAHIASGVDIDILGTKMSPKSFKKFREDVSKSFGNYLNEHGGVFSSDMVGDFGAGAKEKVSDKLSAIDSQIVELQNSMRNLDSEAQEVVEKKIEELYKIRQNILLAKTEIDLYAKRLAGTMFARKTNSGINDNLLAYISAFGRPSGPYEFATGRNAQLSMATGGVFDADRFAEIRKNGHDRIIENGDIKKKYAPFGALPRNYIEMMSLTEEPTMRIIEEAKKLSSANIGRFGLFKGGNQITENINDFLSDRLLDGVSASPSKYDSDFGGFISNFIDSMNKDTVIDNGTSMILKAGKTLFHGTDDDKYKNPLKMGKRYDTGIHFGQDIVPALSRLLTDGLEKYGVRNVLDKFNEDYTVNGMTINKGESLLDRFDVLSELMKESGKNRRLIQATLKEDIKALKVDGNGVSSFEGINFYNNNGELYSYDEAIHTDENKKGFMKDYDLYGKRLFEALERDLGRTKSEELYKNYAAKLTDSKNVRKMLIKAGYGAVAYSNDMEDNGRQSIMMLKDTLFGTSNKDIFGTRGGTDTISPLLASLENLSETIKLFNSRMEVISVASNGGNTVIGRSDMTSGNSDDKNAEELLNTAFNEQYNGGEEAKKKPKKSPKKGATDVADIGQNEPVEIRQNELDQKLAEEISKLSNNILQKLSFNNSNDGVLDGIREGVETIKDILSKQKNSKTLSLSKKTITDIVSAIPKQSKEKSTINIKSIDDIKNIVSVIKEIVSKHQNVKTFSLSKKSLQEISLIISSRSNKKSDREDKFNNDILQSIGKDVSLIKDIISKKKTDTPSFKKIANEISSEIKHAIGSGKDGSNNNDKYRTIIEQLRFIRQNTRAISTKLDSVNNSVKSSKIKSFDKDIKNLISALNGSSSNLGKSILSAIEKGFSGVVINTQISDKPIVAPKVDSVSQFLAEAERQRRLSIADNIKTQESGKNKENNNTGSYQSDKKRLDREKFELELASKGTKKDKLSFIDEEISKITDRIKSSPDDGKLKLEAELASLKRRRIRIENSAGTKEDKLEFNEWRDSLRSQQKEFISNLRGKGPEDISRAVSEEVKRLLNLEENRSVGNYDKKSEIQKLITKLKEFEQSARIKNDKNSLSDAINELKRKYKGEDNAFDATLKGAGIDDRPEKLRKEVERLNLVLDELKSKKEEALNTGDEISAKFYDTLIFQRQTRKDVVQGKQNAADKALRIADENAAARAAKEAERAQKQEQKRLDAMAAAHDKEGNQARSVFNKAVEYGAMSTLVYGFASEAKNAIDVMSRFERQMVEVMKVMDPLYQSQELLTESAKRMAIQYGVSIVESAKGMAVFAQQGKNAAQIIQLTEASLLAANTTTLNAAQATEALTATIRQFNLTDSDAKRVIDSWLEVESRTAISAQTMADAIKISGTSARVAGLSFDEFNGILSAVGSATRETGSQLGTAFKFIISKMRTDDAVTALNRLGVATHNQNGDYRDLMVVLSDLNAKWVEMSQEQKASTAIAIAGTRRYNTLMTLMEKWDDALEAVSMSEDSHGKAMRMNAAVMDTYEKKVQKARASVEAFYASMSKGTTKGFLGGIQESISIFAGIGEKTPLASGLAQAGIVASGISLFSRIGGSMGLGTALGDLKANSEIKSEISKAIASEVKSSIGNGKALFRSENSREAALKRLNVIDSGKNVTSEMNKDSKFLDGRDVLAEKIATRIAGVNKESELYQSTLKRVQNEISRTISSHKEYIEKLGNHKNAVARFGIAAGEFAKKHAIVIAAIGIGLQTLANSEFFKDEKSLTGKTTTGEVIDLAGSLGTAIGAGAAAAQFGGPWAGVAVGALSMLGPLVSNLQSWGEKITGSTRLTLLRLQEESDRLKTLTTSIDSYSRLREKERSGQALTLEEQEQKRVLEQNISLASPTAIKIGHRGIGSSLDEGEFEKLVGRKTEFKDKYASISDQMAYEQMFSQTFGGKTISDDLRKNLFTEQKALDVQLSKLRDFDAEHTGELSESEHSDRMKIIEEIKKIQERISKGNTAINEVEQAFFASVRNRESGVLNATRRGESYEANDGPNDRIRKMFEQIVANRNGNISEARKATSEAILSGIISRGTIKNRTTAIEHAQRTGMLYSATRGRELEGGKQEIILHTRAADGSIRKSESIVMDKKGSDDDYIREVATRKGLDARSIAYTSELSDTLFRYSLKEVEKFSELTRKIGDTIYNSYKAEVDRINSIEGISSKFRIGGIESQYKGSNIRLAEALSATFMRIKSIGSVDLELIEKMADYANNSNPSKAMFAGAEISSQIARHNTLAGATEHLVMSMSTQVQKSNMANQIIEAIYRASFKTERGRDGEVADIGGEEKKRINEYLAMAGLGFDEFDKIRHSLGSEASEEDFKRALMSRVSAAADIMAKKDADDISKYFKMLEDNVERLANIMKQTAEAMEIKRKDSFASSLDYSGMVFDRDIVNSYKGMSSLASMYDDEITELSAVIEASRNGVNIQKNAVDKALKTRDEAIAEYGEDSQQAITANDNYLRLKNNYDQALSSLSISLVKLGNLKGLQQQLKAMATGSFGEHKAFMRTVESSAIGESARNGNISFGVGSSDYNNISLLAEQNRVLSDRRMDIKSQYDAYAQMGKLTEAQKTEMKSLELQLGEIDKAIRENGMKLDTANMNLEKTYAEARRNTRRLQLEHLANAFSGSKDTGRSQKAMFDDNYNRMRGLWRDYVSAMQQNPNAVSEEQKQYMKELAKKMENLRDVGDLMGNPAFNKNYLLASAQDQTIVDNIMQRLQFGETMRQIFSDAGMKEMGRNNPLISQLMDNMMQKQENQRLADVSNQMLDVETEMLGYLKNIAGLMNDPMFMKKIEEGRKSNRDAKNGFANGTTFTGPGGKFESAGLVEVHKGEGLGVLSQTAMARYPMMSRKVLKMISDMNLGTYPGFANGTRLDDDLLAKAFDVDDTTILYSRTLAPRDASDFDIQSGGWMSFPKITAKEISEILSEIKKIGGATAGDTRAAEAYRDDVITFIKWFNRGETSVIVVPKNTPLYTGGWSRGKTADKVDNIQHTSKYDDIHQTIGPYTSPNIRTADSYYRSGGSWSSKKNSKISGMYQTTYDRDILALEIPRMIQNVPSVLRDVFIKRGFDAVSGYDGDQVIPLDGLRGVNGKSNPTLIEANYPRLIEEKRGRVPIRGIDDSFIKKVVVRDAFFNDSYSFSKSAEELGVGLRVLSEVVDYVSLSMRKTVSRDERGNLVLRDVVDPKLKSSIAEQLSIPGERFSSEKAMFRRKDAIKSIAYIVNGMNPDSSRIKIGNFFVPNIKESSQRDRFLQVDEMLSSKIKDMESHSQLYSAFSKLGIRDKSIGYGLSRGLLDSKVKADSNFRNIVFDAIKEAARDIDKPDTVAGRMRTATRKFLDPHGIEEFPKEYLNRESIVNLAKFRFSQTSATKRNDSVTIPQLIKFLKNDQKISMSYKPDYSLEEYRIIEDVRKEIRDTLEQGGRISRAKAIRSANRRVLKKFFDTELSSTTQQNSDDTLPFPSTKITTGVDRSVTVNNPRQAAKTAFARDVFDYGGRSDILGLGASERLMQYVPDSNLRTLADIMRVNTGNMWTPASGHNVSVKADGFNQGGRIFMNARAPYSYAVHEIMHGANDSVFGAYNSSREAMAVLGEMAIGGTNNPSYGNYFTQKAYSGLKLGSNPAKNAQAIFDILAKNGNYKYQWEGINSGLRDFNNGYVTSELETAAGKRDFKHGYAQAASVIAEYGKNTGTSSQKDIDRMYRSLEKLFEKATGSTTIDFTSHGEKFNIKEFASACADFRASVDKNSATLSHNEVLALIEKRATQNRENKSTNFKENYKSLRRERELNESYGKKYGVILRDGRAYSAYNPIERIRQSRVADFFRAGGLDYAKSSAVDFATKTAKNIVTFAPRKYRDISSSIGDFYTTKLRPGVSMVPGDVKRAALNVASGAADFGRFTYDKLLSGPVGDLRDIALGGKNFLTEKMIGLRLIGPNMADRARNTKRWFVDNFTERGLIDRKKSITDNLRSSNYKLSESSRKLGSVSGRLNDYLWETGNGYLADQGKLSGMIRQEAIQKSAVDSAKQGVESANLSAKDLKSINRRLAVIDYAKKKYRGARLRYAIASQGVEDFGRYVRGKYTGIKDFTRESGHRFAEDFRNNIEITKGIWDGTGGRLIRGTSNAAKYVYETSGRLVRGTSNVAKDMYIAGRGFVRDTANDVKNFYLNNTNSGIQRQIDSAMHGEDFAEAIRLNNIKNNLPQNRAKRFADDSYQRLRNSKFGKDIRLRYAIASQGVEDFGKYVHDRYNGTRGFVREAGNKFAEDFRNNIDITGKIFRGAGDGLSKLQSGSLRLANWAGRSVARGIGNFGRYLYGKGADFVDYMRPSNIEKRMSENVERNRVKLEKSQSMRQRAVDKFNDFVENYAPDKSRIRYNDYSGKNKKKLRIRERDIRVLNEEFDARRSELMGASVRQGEIVRERASRYNRSKAVYDFLSPKKNAEAVASARDRVVGAYRGTTDFISKVATGTYNGVGRFAKYVGDKTYGAYDATNKAVRRFATENFTESGIKSKYAKQYRAERLRYNDLSSSVNQRLMEEAYRYPSDIESVNRLSEEQSAIDSNFNKTSSRLRRNAAVKLAIASIPRRVRNFKLGDVRVPFTGAIRAEREVGVPVDINNLNYRNTRNLTLRETAGILSEKYDIARKNVNSKINDIKTNVRDRIAEANSFISEKYNTAREGVNSRINDIRENVRGKIVDANSFLSEKYNTAHESVRSKINDIKTNIESKLEQARIAKDKKVQEKEAARKQKEAERKAARDARVRNIGESRFNSARRGRGLRSWFIDNFTEAGLERRQRTLVNRVRSSAYRYGEATRKFSGANKAFEVASNQMLENFGDGYLQIGVNPQETFSKDTGRLNTIGKQVAKQKAAKDTYRERVSRDVANAIEYLPSINKRLANVRAVNRVFGFVGDKVFKPVANKVGGTINNFAGSATNAAFAMMSLKGAIDNGKMFFTGKRFNKDTGEYEALTDFEKGQAGFNAASNASFFMSQVIGGKHTKASGFFGGAGSALSMASAVHNMANGNVAQGSLQLTQAAMFNPQLRNFATNQLGKTAFGQKVLQKMPRMGKSYGYGAALQMGGDLLASQFEEGSNAWVASKLASEAGTVMQFMSPAGAALTLGMNGINEYINLGDDAYELQTGQALEALSRRNGDSGSWYSTSTLGYFSDTLLGGLIGTRERAHRAAAADMQSQAAADSINKNTADYNKALKTSRDVRFGDNATMTQKAQAALAAVELQNSFFKQHTGFQDDKLIDKDSATILAMTGVGVDDMFKRYGWSDNNNRIASNSKNAAKHKAEAEMHRQNAKSRTVSKAWGKDEKDKAAAGEAEAAAQGERIKSRRTVLDTVKNDDLQKEARERTQDYFDKKYGKKHGEKADVYGENGLLVQVRKAKRDEEIKKEQKNLADQKRKINEARNDFFKKNTHQFSYSSLEELEHRARLGDEKAVEELKIFNEKSKSHTFGGKTISEMQEGVKGTEKRIGELSGKKVTSDGKITAEEFLQMDALANKDYGVRIKQNSEEREKVASKLKEAEEDLKNMEGVSSKEAITKKKAEIEAYKKRLGQHDEADLALKTGRAIEERIKGGKLVDPKKLASDVSDMENEAKDAQAALDNEKVLREIKKNGKATVKINGKDREVTRDDLVKMADRDGSRRAAKKKAFEDASAKVEEETNVEFVRQQLIKENGGDASKVTDDMVKARIAQNKENARKEAEKRENERQDKIYGSSVFGKREAAKKAFDDSVARRDKNKARIAELEKKKKSKTITGKEEEELREAKNMQTYYDRAVDRNQGELNRTNRAVVARQRAAREGRGGDARLIGLSEEDYKKEKESNEKRIKELEGKKSANEKRKAELEEKQKSGQKLTKEEQEELDRINSEGRELSRRKNMTKTMFAESDLRRFKKDKNRLAELRQKKADGKTLTEDEQKELDLLGKKDFSAESEKKLVSNIDAAYKEQNGGMSFAQLEEEERKERRKITLDNLGLKSIKYNKKTGRYEAEDDKKANTPSVDERTESLGGEDTKQTADAFGSGPRTAGVSGTSQTTVGDDKNIGEISKDTAAITETLAQVLEKMGEILKLIPQASGSAGEKNTPPKEGDRVPV